MEKGEMNSLSIILVNGRDARHLGRLEAPLKQDDTVVIFPPLAGG
jgi:molybdopterin converting factor small subunit